VLSQIGDDLDPTIPNYMLEYYMDQNPTICKYDIRYNAAVATAIYEKGQARQGFVPDLDTTTTSCS